MDSDIIYMGDSTTTPASLVAQIGNDNTEEDISSIEVQPLQPVPPQIPPQQLQCTSPIAYPVPLTPLPRDHLLLDYTPNESSFNVENGLERLISCLPPLRPFSCKVWHCEVTTGERQHLVMKLLKALLSTVAPLAPSDFRDPRAKEIVHFARRVEQCFFEKADDSEEYFHLVAEKTGKIQMELQSRKRARMNRTMAENGRNDQSSMRPSST